MESVDLIVTDPQGERRPMAAKISPSEKLVIWAVSTLTALAMSYGMMKTVQANHTDQIQENKATIQAQGSDLRQELYTAIGATEDRLSVRLGELNTQIEGLNAKLDAERDRREADTKVILRAIGNLEGRGTNDPAKRQ